MTLSQRLARLDQCVDALVRPAAKAIVAALPLVVVKAIASINTKG